MATTPLGNCKGGAFSGTPQKSSLWDVLSMEQNKEDKGRLGDPLGGPKLSRGPTWRKATEAEEDLGLSQIMVSHGTQVLKRCPHPLAHPKLE